MQECFREVSQRSTDVRETLLNAAVALGDKFTDVAISCPPFYVLTIAGQTDREKHFGPCKQYISSTRQCPLFLLAAGGGGRRARRRRWEAGMIAGGGGGRWAGEHRTAAVASEAEIGFLLSSARQSPPLSRQSK